INLSEPAAPSVESSIQFGSYFGVGVAIVVDGTYAYVADDSTGGIHVLDISNPSMPTWKVSSLGFSAVAISRAGLNLFLAAQSQGLLVVNAKSPVSPTISARYATAGNANGVASLSSNLYA